MTTELSPKLVEIRENLKKELVRGTKTNFGTFLFFDERGFAHFDFKGRKGITGPLALHFVQVKKEK